MFKLRRHMEILIMQNSFVSAQMNVLKEEIDDLKAITHTNESKRSEEINDLKLLVYEKELKLNCVSRYPRLSRNILWNISEWKIFALIHGIEI